MNTSRGCCRVGGWVMVMMVSCASPSQIVAPPSSSHQDSVREADVDELAALEKEGDKALLEENYAVAVDLFEKLLQRDSSRSEWLYNRAYSLSKLSQTEKALAAYRRLLEVEPDDIEALLNVARIQVAKGHLAEAQKTLEGARLNHPNHQNLLRSLAAILLKRKEYSEARDILRQILACHPSDHWTYYTLALSHYEQKQYLLAQTVVQRALKLIDSSDPDLLSLQGIIYAEQKNDEAAVQILNRVLQLHPQHVEANNNLGSIALRHRDYPLAEKKFTAVVKADDNVQGQLNLGYAQMGLEKWEAAAKTLEKARRELSKLKGTSAKTDEHTILQPLVIIYQTLGESQKAFETADQYLLMTQQTCAANEYDGFCGRYNGIKMMLKMESSSGQSGVKSSDR